MHSYGLIVKNFEKTGSVESFKLHDNGAGKDIPGHILFGSRGTG